MTDHFFGITDTGRSRDNNEDTFIAQKVLKDQYVAACVIDGVGGYDGGEVAARIAHDSILSYLQIPSGDTLTMMKEAVKAANEKIYNEKLQDTQNKSMACVLTLALTDTKNNRFYYAHVGDTRLYLLRDQTLIKVTKDHSFVGYLEDTGRLSEEAAMTHPKRNEINKALGFDAQISINSDYIETGESPFLPGDLLLLCSDGLTDMINNQTITSILTTNKALSEKGAELITAANEAGGKDNITVVLVHNNKKPAKQKALKPVLPVKKNETDKIDNEPVAARVPAPLQTLPVKQNSSAIVYVLSFLALLFLGAFLWKVFNQSPEEEDQLVNPPGQLVHNELTQSLLDSINLTPEKNFTISDSVFRRSLIVSDTFLLEKDSFHLNGNGITLIRDSVYNGPGILIPSTAKLIRLENLVLLNFDVGVLANSKVLQLKNVRFANCRIPLQYSLQFPANRYINGTITDTVLFKSDSLPK